MGDHISSMDHSGLKVVFATDPIRKAAEIIVPQLISKIKLGPVVLLLPGGSAITVAEEIIKLLKKNDLNDLSNLTISLGDERWDIEPDHAGSNWRELNGKTTIIKYIKNLGGHEYNILKIGRNLEDSSYDFNVFLKIKRKAKSVFFSIQGAGADGHTAGILPTKDFKEYKSIYRTGLLASCHSNLSGNKGFPYRITITPRMINKSIVFVIVKARNNPEKIEMLKSVVEELKNGNGKRSIHPVLTALRKGTLITDIDITNN